ncbi:MAG TPA: hypothetical protein VGM01_12620 [Ktedonobacteraceae bacterium]|jgi:hypothetical protein
MLVFLLEFWLDGIKDFFTDLESKRSFNSLLPQMAERLGDVPLKECSLDEGIRLLEEAKEVNTTRGTKPHKDYTRHLALIKQLIPEDLVAQVMSTTSIRHWGEDEIEDEVDLSDLAPDEVVADFIEAEADGDLDLAYQILSQESPLLEGLTKEDWIKRRSEWDARFAPDDLYLSLLAIHEIPKPKTRLSIPGNKQSDDETTSLRALDQHMKKTARSLNLTEMQRMSEDEQQHYAEAVLLPIEQSLYYIDTLARKEPLDRSVYEEAAARAGSFGFNERSLAHLQVLEERFPEDRALPLQISARLQQRLAEKYREANDDEHASFYLDLAEKSCVAALELEENISTRLSLAEILIDKDERLMRQKSICSRPKMG